MTGHYEGGRYRWEPEEVPLCSMCNKEIATRATIHAGILLCDSAECACLYVEQECDEIEYFEDKEDGGIGK